ncbi:hypothetical protein JXA70_09815 [candidate division KSB1 bacterium]|nr:hypothetical protein [candidate division KSB1 bacterium]
MKNRLITIIVSAVALLIAACGDSGTGNDPEKSPALSVNRNTIELSGNPYGDRILLTNSGGGQLQWYIDEKPDWIELSNTNGLGVNSTDTVSIRIFTSFDQLDYGKYDGQIKISSNGGQVTVFLNLDYKPPQLRIENGIINLDRHYRYSELVIVNEGGGELEWQISYSPPWLQFAQDSGLVYKSQTDSLPFYAKLSELDYGEYNDKVSIKSNGGETEINVYLTYVREVEVFAGIGAANVELGDTFLMVKKLYGNPTSSGYVRPADTLFIHNVKYDYIGLDVRIKNNSPILFGNGQVGFIRLLDPYDGMTPELIGLKSSANDLIAAYGQPQQKRGSEWLYDGITYVVKNNTVSEMIIQDPDF